MIDKLILFFTENGQGIAVLLLSIIGILNSLNIRRYNERITNLEICVLQANEKIANSSISFNILKEDFVNLKERVMYIENSNPELCMELMSLKEEQDETKENESESE